MHFNNRCILGRNIVHSKAIDTIFINIGDRWIKEYSSDNCNIYPLIFNTMIDNFDKHIERDGKFAQDCKCIQDDIKLLISYRKKLISDFYDPEKRLIIEKQIRAAIVKHSYRYQDKYIQKVSKATGIPIGPILYLIEKDEIKEIKRIKENLAKESDEESNDDFEEEEKAPTQEKPKSTKN